VIRMSSEELAFYDALTCPQVVKDFCDNEVLVAMTRKFANELRKNRAINW